MDIQKLLKRLSKPIKQCKIITQQFNLFLELEKYKKWVLNFKSKNKKFWGALEIVRSEIYILKMGNMKI